MLEEGDDENLKQKQKGDNYNLWFFVFSVPVLRQLSAVAHEEGNKIIDWNLLTKTEQVKEGELGKRR